MNMTYCAFSNTLEDLKQCADLLDSDEPNATDKDEAELEAAAQMFAVMERMQVHRLQITNRARLVRERRTAR